MLTTDAVTSTVDKDNPTLLVGTIVPPTLQLFDTTSVVVVWWNIDPDIPWIVMV
jgi:hypothetical protein